MIGSIGRMLRYILDHYVTACLFLSLFILTFLGAGDIPVVSALGLLLCVVGITQPPGRADMWVLAPLLVYQLVSMASSWAVYGNIASGYAPLQAIFPVFYLLLACLDGAEAGLLRRSCVAWAGAAAAIGVGQFAYRAVTVGSGRLSGIVGNPNALGIFLVLGWFVLTSCQWERPSRLRHLEPLILAALGLTLSMGSFAAMAAGIAAVLLHEGRSSPRKTFWLACRLLAKASLGIGTGILLYLSADRTGQRWMCLVVLAYLLALAAGWGEVERFLEEKRPVSAVLSGMGVLVAGTAVLIRPSAAATFAERLEMMRNGLGYITVDPLLGVGPYQWRLLNLADGDKYFNTYHIHNVLIHVGVELGLVALAMLVLAAARIWAKQKDTALRGECFAFFFHNMMDTSFFYMGVTGLVLLTAGGPERGGKPLPAAAARGLFGVFGAVFVFDLLCWMGVGLGG